MQQNEQDQAAKDIESIRTACGVIDEDSLIDQALHDKAMSDYIQNSLTALEKLFEPGLSRTNGENNTNNYLLQVYYRDPSFPTYKSIQSELKKNGLQYLPKRKKKKVKRRSTFVIQLRKKVLITINNSDYWTKWQLTCKNWKAILNRSQNFCYFMVVRESVKHIPSLHYSNWRNLWEMESSCAPQLDPPPPTFFTDKQSILCSDLG
jgi:hypothetical protein